MPRIEPAPPAATAAGRDLEDRIRKARGEISSLYAVLLNSPPVADGWERLLTAIRQKTSLSPRLRELIILRIAVINRAQYEFDAHARHASAAGVSDEELAAMAAGDVSPLSQREQLVLAFADAMTRDVEVPDALFAQIRQAFDAAGLVDLTATIAAYNMVSRFLVALHVR